jgi:hypothetical protein
VLEGLPEAGGTVVIAYAAVGEEPVVGVPVFHDAAAKAALWGHHRGPENRNTHLFILLSLISADQAIVEGGYPKALASRGSSGTQGRRRGV